jgi:hypothetical protein
MTANGFVHTGGPTEDALFDWLGGRLHPQAAQWISEHVAGCARCAAAVEQVHAVRDALEPPELSPFQRQRDLQAVRRRLEAPRRRLPRLALASALTFAVMAVVVWMGARRLPSSHRTEISRLVHSGWQPELNARATSSVPFEILTPGAQPSRRPKVPTASETLSVPAGGRMVARWGRARVAIEGGQGGARLQLLASGEDERRLRLERGRVLLDVDPLRPGQTLAVVTDDALVTVHGTVFLVEASAAGTQVAVTRGLVKVASRGRIIDVSAGMQLSRPEDVPAPIAPEARRALDELAPTAPRQDWSPVGIPDPETRRPKAMPTAPREAWNPLRVPDPMNQARKEVMAGEYAHAVEQLESLRRHAPPTQSARAGLLEAQALRLALQPDKALPILEQVAQHAASGAEAEQGQLLYAQTLARDLADPRRAAEAYAEAQRRFPNGIFAEEVAYRLGEALLGAGETRGGVAALERYLTTFSSGAHVDEAHLLVAAARRDRLNDCAGALPHLHAVAAGGAQKLTNPRAELALIGEARCLSALGRTAEARAAYSRYLEERPRGRFADEARAQTASSRR